MCLLDESRPVMHKSVRYNCRVIFRGQKILLVRPKMHLCDDGNYREGRWFTAWSKPRTLEDYILPQQLAQITGQARISSGLTARWLLMRVGAGVCPVWRRCTASTGRLLWQRNL
jgi:predicted amidohydrolase